MATPDHRSAVRYHAPTRPSPVVLGAGAARPHDPLHGRLRPLLRGRQRTHSASALLLVDAAAGLLARGVPQHLARAASGARQVRAVVPVAVSYTHLRAHETRHDLVCRLLLEKKKQHSY